MVWARGHQHDWDLFAAEVNDPAWGYESVLNLYRRLEDWHGAPDPMYRGTGGPVFVQPAPDPNPIAPAMIAGALSVGIPTFEKIHCQECRPVWLTRCRLDVIRGSRPSQKPRSLAPHGFQSIRPIMIDANTLSDPDDLKAAIACVELCREVANSAPLRPFVKREVMPGNLKGAELEHFIRNAATSFWHRLQIQMDQGLILALLVKYLRSLAIALE